MRKMRKNKEKRKMMIQMMEMQKRRGKGKTTGHQKTAGKNKDERKWTMVYLKSQSQVLVKLQPVNFTFQKPNLVM